MLHGVGVPVHTETPVLQVQPPTAWHALPLVLALQPSGVPVHEAALDHAQLLADRQVVLDVLLVQGVAVPVQLPPAVFHVQPRLAAHIVLLTLSAQDVGVPLQASVALLHVQPDCPVHVVRLVLSLQGAAVPMQLAPVDATHEQPACKAHDAEVVREAQA